MLFYFSCVCFFVFGFCMPERKSIAEVRWQMVHVRCCRELGPDSFQFLRFFPMSLAIFTCQANKIKDNETHTVYEEINIKWRPKNISTSSLSCAFSVVTHTSNVLVHTGGPMFCKYKIRVSYKLSQHPILGHDA